MGGRERSLNQALLTKKIPAGFFVVPFLNVREKTFQLKAHNVCVCSCGDHFLQRGDAGPAAL